MNLLASARSATLVAAALVASSCATTDLANKEAQVRIFNLYRAGVVTPLPRTLEGCESLGSVTVTAPELFQVQSSGSYDPLDQLPVLRARAARKSADTVLVSFEPAPQRGHRTMRGTIFRCGSQPLPPELGEPLTQRKLGSEG